MRAGRRAATLKPTTATAQLLSLVRGWGGGGVTSHRKYFASPMTGEDAGGGGRTQSNLEDKNGPVCS